MNQYRYLPKFDEESCDGCVKRRQEHENENALRSRVAWVSVYFFSWGR
jgi:hypothetical protein